ncbi:hypothetical protein ALC60_09465, partial [Trachymyrmex zeteki]
SAYLGVAAPNWVDDLVANINEDVRHRLIDVNKNIENLNTQIENSVQQTLAQVHKTIEDLPRDGQGHLITTGNNVIINSVNGVTMIKIAKSGYTPNGVPYRNVTTDLNNGDYLYHDETFYNSTSNAMERIRWRQNLRNPGAQLEYLPNE